MARSRGALRAVACLLAAAVAAPAGAVGARSFKSGPIQVTADGRWVWVANADQDTVSRLDTTTDAVVEYPLPDPATKDLPRGLSVTEDGAEVWVACHDSDRIVVLSGADGSHRATIDLPWGSGPYSVALSRDQGRALVTLHRAEALALVDVATRTVTHRLEPVYWSPLGIAWMEDGVTAWVTHLFADGEDPFLTRVDLSGPEPKVATKLIVKSTNPKQSSRLAAPYQVAEGGYLTFRGHLAQVPSASGRNRLWIPTQYNNINEDVYTSDSTVQSTVRTLDLDAHLIPNTNADKVILTAVHVHDPAGSNAYVGPGWDARVSGPVDIAFSADGARAWIAFEQSDDVLAMPTSTPAFKPSAATPPLTEIPVGSRPLGLVASPTSDLGWAWNSLDGTVSVLDLAGGTELRRVAVTGTPAQPTAALLRGAKIFHASEDPAAPGAISDNQKIACASCHPHGEHDGRIWDFEHLPGNHGPRSSMSLLGLSQTFAPVPPGQRGQLHRSGDRDEVQDFDYTFSGVNMMGTGYGAMQPELGPPNAGAATALDDLAAYVLSLEPVRRSPHRAADGSLTDAARRGATFFVGADNRNHPADSACATCHVPETGFVDFAFHDVGQRRPAAERELQAHNWTVNTPTLVGVWTSPPYDGVTGWASSMLGVLKDLRGRTSHGTPGGLTGRQLRDLAEFVLSIDGNTTAAEVRAARDVAPPRVVRVAPTSPTRIDVWFDETVDPSAASPSAWRVRQVGGPDVPVTGATWDGQNGDRVTLAVDRLATGCSPVAYEVVPLGPILDQADRASGNAANALDVADPANTVAFPFGPTLTITLGASGYENVTIPVHDASVVGSGLASWSHGSVWLGVNGSSSHSGFVRFDWVAAFRAATGVTSSADILDASFSLEPEWGDVNVVEARRLLKPWSDGGHGDWASNPQGSPTWTHARPGGATPLAWGRANADMRTAGVEGDVPSDYGGPNDTAFTPDAVVTMAAINERLVVGGSGVAGAARFWFDNPALDHGWCLRVRPRATPYYHEVKFANGSAELRQAAPVLTLMYAIAPTVTVPPSEVSGPASGSPLLVAREPSALALDFQDLALGAGGYNVYEGNVGAFTAQPADWYGHAGALCGAPTVPFGAGRLRTRLSPAPGSHYYLVTAEDGCLEGPSGSDSLGAAHPAARLDCAP